MRLLWALRCDTFTYPAPQLRHGDREGTDDWGGDCVSADSDRPWPAWRDAQRNDTGECGQHGSARPPVSDTSWQLVPSWSTRTPWAL
jgi:hypothetical protein